MLDIKRIFFRLFGVLLYDDKNYTMRVLRTVGCFIEWKWKFLLLFRESHKPEGNTWWLPAWKVEGNETDIEAIMREVQEETWYTTPFHTYEYLKTYEFRFLEYGVVFPVFRLVLEKKISVTLDMTSHSAWKFVTPHAALNLRLIHGIDRVIRETYGIDDVSTRYSLSHTENIHSVSESSEMFPNRDKKER